MGQFKKIVYLSEAQKNELFTYGTITSNNTTITYSADDLYVTPDKSIDTIQMNGSSYTPINGAVNLGSVLTSASGKANNSIVAPVESTTAASQLYNQGDIFIYNDQLYRAISTIATSTNITPNTNCEAIQVIDLIEEKYTKPSTGIPASDLASGVIPSVLVTDVQVNGTSVVSSGMANIPIAGSNPGVVAIDSSGGITINSDNELTVVRANDNQYKNGNDNWKVVTPYGQHRATFYGLAKAAGDTSQASSDNAVGTYTNDAKTAIKTMLSIAELPAVTSSDNGKVLRVVSGAWAAASLPSASGVSF